MTKICTSSCQGKTCDYWSGEEDYTCAFLEKDYGCSCTGCKCALDVMLKSCEHFKYRGDGNCDDGNNNAGCLFDGGDCCAKSLGKDVMKTYCKMCKCLDPNPKPYTPPPCGIEKYKGDGNCDD